jgi:hypothetical protein
MLSAVYSNVAQDSDGYWTPNYHLFTPLINDDICPPIPPLFRE